MSRAAAGASVVVALLSCVAPRPALAGDKHPIEFAEPRPDKALVFFIRTNRMSGSANTMYLYADQVLLGVMDNGTYGYAYAEPGRHLLWVVWGGATREVEFVPGETYYLDVWRDIGIVSEARGRELIEKVGRRVTPDEGELRRAAKHIRNRYDSAAEREGSKQKAAVAEAVAPPPPGSTEGLLRIPAYTPIALELLETVTSEFSPAGSAVRFHVSEDASVDGRVFVSRGTMAEGVIREAGQAGPYGRAGVLEIAVPSLPAVDGTQVPLVAQLASAGRGREDVGAGLLGLLPGLAVRGREAYYLAGETFRVWTRGDIHVKPGETTAAGDPDRGSEPPGAAKDPVGPADEEIPTTVEARGPGSVRFNPGKGFAPDDLKIVLTSSTEPSPAEVRAVGGMALPAPVRATRVVRTRDGWECEFDGWSVVRYMRPGPGSGALPIDLGGRLSDGRPFAAGVTVEFLIER